MYPRILTPTKIRTRTTTATKTSIVLREGTIEPRTVAPQTGMCNEGLILYIRLLFLPLLCNALQLFSLWFPFTYFHSVIIVSLSSSFFFYLRFVLSCCSKPSSAFHAPPFHSGILLRMLLGLFVIIFLFILTFVPIQKCRR